MPRLTFYGAAQTVTGSKYLLESKGSKLLIDCGLFQGLKQLRELNWEPPGFSPSDVDAVVLTHAHLDHCGYLPRIVRDGFSGQIHCTGATADLAELILLDSAKIQEEDAEYANRKGFSKHKPALPLYTTEDAEAAVKKLKSKRRDDWFRPAEGFRVRFRDVGHLLGAVCLEVEVTENENTVRLVFSGDVGRYGAPLYHDPAAPPECDYLICESTYGGRTHPDLPVQQQLADLVNSTNDRGGVLLIASFAVGRAQQLIYLLRVLMSEGKIPHLPVFLDSPMAVDATHIYSDHHEDHDLAEGELAGSETALRGPNVHLSRSVQESKLINKTRGPGVIIASSGMMTGGRILHHLRQRLGDSRNTVVLGGFMAEGTRGRRLQDGERTMRMHGREIPVNARIEQLTGLSGHADHQELLRWLEPLPTPKKTFLTHGEIDSAEALAEALKEKNWVVEIPALGQSFELS